MSSSEEDVFEDVDSSFNQTLEDNTIDGAKRELKNRNNPEAVENVTNLLSQCKVGGADKYQLDGSTLVYVDSDEDLGQVEVVEVGHVVGVPEGCGVLADGDVVDEDEATMPDDVVDFDVEDAQDGEALGQNEATGHF